MTVTASERRTADAREAQQTRRADRARQFMHAAEIVLLGHDDDETLGLDGWDPARFRGKPGVR